MSAPWLVLMMGADRQAASADMRRELRIIMHSWWRTLGLRLPASLLLLTNEWFDDVTR